MKRKLKIKFVLFTVLIIRFFVLSLIFLPMAFASVDIEKEPSDTKKKIELSENKDGPAESKRKEILEEATSALRETQNALKALDGKKIKEALSSLEKSIGKLEIILARDPELALAPSHVSTTTYNLLGDIQSVKVLRVQIENAIDDRRLQNARQLIRNPDLCNNLAEELMHQVEKCFNGGVDVTEFFY